MRLGRTLAALTLVITSSGCGDDEDSRPTPTPTQSPTPNPTPTPTPAPTPAPSPTPVTIAFNFAQGTEEWLADYTDYVQGDETNIAFATAVERLPAPLSDRTGFLLRGTNRADDVFLYLSRPVTGLQPSRRYRVETRITFATNAPAECAGIGGAPGEAVIVKAGATATIPGKVLERQMLVRSNIDKGNQEDEGRDLRNLGNIAQTVSGTCSAVPYQTKTLARTPAASPVVTTDATGRLWLVIGTDSGFEGTTAIYYLEGSVTLTPV
jgi:hypothetical protein